MSADFDVAARLAEGFAAVDNTQTYVWACAARGYHHPDLTLHGAQVRDWYGTEDGLDLSALDADCAALRSLAQSAAEAAHSVRAQVAALASAWRGEGGSAAADFLYRHSESAAQVAAAAEAAAGSSQRLRDELWRIVDGKAGATISIDDRTQPQRSAWLSAARTVLANGTVSEEATAVVDSEIRPFAETAIGGDWVAAMRMAVGDVAAAYRAAVEAVATRPVVRFDIPGELGPRVRAPTPAAPSMVAAPASSTARTFAVPEAGGFPAAAPAVQTVPAGMPNPAVAGLNSPAATSPPVPPESPALVPPAGVPTAATPPAMPDFAGGVGALPGRLADALGGLFGGDSSGLGSPGIGAPGPELEPLDVPEPMEVPELGVGEDLAADELGEDGERTSNDELTADEELTEDEERDDEELTEDEERDDEELTEEADESEEDGAHSTAETAAETAGEQTPVEPAVPECPPGSAQEPAVEEPVPPVPVPPVPVPPVPVPADPAATPCEIAADELPQVGE